MIVREYKSEDVHAIEELYRRMGFDYALPKLDGGAAVLTRVVENGAGMAGALHVRKDAEAYLFLDNGLSARARWGTVQALDRECCPILKSDGFDQVVAWIPKEIEWGFSHALVKLGFRKARDSFSAWSKDLL